MSPFPGFTEVVRAKENRSVSTSGQLRRGTIRHEGIDDAGLRRRCVDRNSVDFLVQQSTGQSFPMLTLVIAAVDAAFRSIASIPRRGIEPVRIRRVEDEVDERDSITLGQDAFEGLATVRCFVDAPLTAHPHSSHGSDVNNVGVSRVDHDFSDMSALVEAHIRPVLSRVCRFEDTRPSE